eukprot:947140-Prorocentrum_minimum.AAC.2
MNGASVGTVISETKQCLLAYFRVSVEGTMYSFQELVESFSAGSTSQQSSGPTHHHEVHWRSSPTRRPRLVRVVSSLERAGGSEINQPLDYRTPSRVPQNSRAHVRRGQDERAHQGNARQAGHQLYLPYCHHWRSCRNRTREPGGGAAC